jgi:glycerol-3-phosphate acyltransferase PlsX
LLLAAKAIKGFQSRVDYDEYGGAPLLGVNGVSVICHGRSSAKAIKNAIRVASESVDNCLPDAIRDTFKSVENREVERANAQKSS